MDGSEHRALTQLDTALPTAVVHSNNLTDRVHYVGVLFFVVIAITERLSTIGCCKIVSPYENIDVAFFGKVLSFAIALYRKSGMKNQLEL